jgi:hypothetical protein
VLVLGTGGLSHQLDGERAGFINKDFDLQFMESLTADPTWATQYSIHQLVEKTGTQGVELLMWLAARGMLWAPKARKLHSQLPHPHQQHRGRPDAAGAGDRQRRKKPQVGAPPADNPCTMNSAIAIGLSGMQAAQVRGRVAPHRQRADRDFQRQRW